MDMKKVIIEVDAMEPQVTMVYRYKCFRQTTIEALIDCLLEAFPDVFRTYPFLKHQIQALDVYQDGEYEQREQMAEILDGIELDGLLRINVQGVDVWGVGYEVVEIQV